MKKTFLLLIFLITGVSMSLAQDEDPTRKGKIFREVQEFKMKYLAQEMELTEAQKERFFELYEEMSESKKQCYHEAAMMERRLKQDKDASEGDYQQVRQALSQANANWAEIEKQYDEKFSEFLSQKQIYKMKEAEISFRDKFEEMKHNRRKVHHKRQE